MDTIYTKNAPDAIGPYSQAVKIGDMLYTSGQIAINPATGNVEATDIVGQSKQVMANLKAVLEATGTCFDKFIQFGNLNITLDSFHAKAIFSQVKQ